MNFEIFEKITESYICIDIKGIIQYCNQSFIKSTLYSKQELVGHNLLDFIHLNDYNTIKRNLEMLDNDFPLDSLKFRLLKQFGQNFMQKEYDIVLSIVDSVKSIQLVENKLNKYTTALLQPEMEKKRKEPNKIDINKIPLNIVEVSFHKTYQYLSQFNLQKRKDFNKFISVHPEKIVSAFKMAKLMKFNDKTLQSFQVDSLEELFTQYSAKFISELEIQLLPLLYDLINEQRKGEIELLFATNQKKVHHFILYWKMTTPAQEKYDSVVISFIDATSKSYLLKSIEQSDHNFQRIIESFGGEIYTCSEEHIIEYANYEAKRKYDCNPIGKKCYTILYGLDQRCPWCQNEKLFQERKEIETEILNPKDNRWYRVIVTPSYDSQGKISKTIVMIDINEQKEAKEILLIQSKRLEVLNQIYKIKHEESTFEVFFNQILEACFLQGNFSAGCIIILDDNQQNGTIMAQSNLSQRIISKIYHDNFKIIKKIPTFINDIPHYIPEFKDETTIGSIATIPILSANREIGYLILIRKSTTEFSNHEMGFLLTLGKEVGTIVSSAKSELELKESLSEKEVLLKEIHHRVKNNLQIIISLFNLQKRNLKDEKIKETFEDSKNRIKSMALIHEILYQTENYVHLNYKRYIRALISNLVRSYQKIISNINVEYDIEDISIDINDAIPLALIINELVSNSLKYAFADEIKSKKLSISLKQNKNEVILTITDNGKGFPTNYDATKSKSLGLRLVSMLTKQLHGTYERINDQGTKSMIKFAITDN